MQYTFEQLIDVPMLQKLMDDFYLVTGIPTGICDNNSHFFTATGWKRVCLQFHRVNPLTLEHCLKSDRYILDHLHEGPFVGYCCPRGLNDYAVPLYIEGQHLANVMTGQMFHQPPNLDFFRDQAKTFGFDEQDYIAAVQEIPIVPQERIEHIMAFLVSLTGALAKVGLAQLQRLEVERQRLEEAQALTEELRTYRFHLEELVAERTAELKNEIAGHKRTQKQLSRAKEAAESANLAKSVFLANMSHELRTPLNAVLGFAQMLRGDPAIGPAQRDSLDIIRRSGEHLLSLIDEVLDISRIEAGRIKVTPAPFDLYAAFEAIRGMTETQAKAKGISFLMELDESLPRYVHADEKRLKQIIINLTGNAVKFTGDGGVALRARFADGMLRVEVEDSGPGIPPELLPRLFQRFEQGGQRKDGAGLGLYISRKLVEMMGGKAVAENLPGGGALFSFTVACETASASTAGASRPRRFVSALAPGQAPVTVLIVEDTPESRLLLTGALTRVGFTVVTAANGAEGLEAFAREKPDLVLMDMRMPVMDGYEATRRIKATAAGKTTPVIAITASVFSEQRQKVLDTGADDFLRKPVVFDELFDAVGRLLGLDYVYQEEQAAPAALADEPARAQAARLPKELSDGLGRTLASLDLKAFKGLLPEVGKLAPELAATLSVLADGYEITRLSDILAGMEDRP